MSCPKCGCKVTYQYDRGCDGEDFSDDYSLERCSACRHIFYFDDAGPDDD